MTKLIEHRRPKPRFARSINVERDAGSEAIQSYLPVGRAVATIEHLARALAADSGEVALSVTGPYGSGKSSMALLIDGLCAARNSEDRRATDSLLKSVAPEVLELVDTARKRSGGEKQGFIRAVATAQREPVGHTVLRALINGAEGFSAPARSRAPLAKFVKAGRRLEASVRRREDRVDAKQIRELIQQLTHIAPVLLLIDEFGKNLEAFADSPGEADLFLLQELAEWTRHTGSPRFALITLQHMAFADYADTASAVQRREWVKVHGRFEDIPFIDTPAQTRALVAASFEGRSRTLAGALDTWASKQVAPLRTLGLNDLASDVSLLKACWPLHPLSLMVLPELCQRYGQNERTMFSFLAGTGALSVPAFLNENELRGGKPLPAVRLDRVYDYFLESASAVAGVSSDASRWMEIDTRIRDAVGLTAGQRRVLKAVGLLNLVSAGGALRASREVVEYAAVDGRAGTRSPSEVQRALRELEAKGLLTYRAYADEFRVWQGTDFDLRSAIQRARRRLKDEPPSTVLDRVMPLQPLVAARHSHQTGTLRSFDRAWLSPDVDAVMPLQGSDHADGLLFYVLGEEPPLKSVEMAKGDKPIVFASSSHAWLLVDSALELAAIDELLRLDENVQTDWVARKELAERRVTAATQLRSAFESAYGGSGTKWSWLPTADITGGGWCTSQAPSASAIASSVADDYYPEALRLSNDLLNRHELTSQAAKARRQLAEAMVTRARDEGLGLEGYGPDRTMYRSLLLQMAFHRPGDDGFEFTQPSRSPKAGAWSVWSQLVKTLRHATATRVNVQDLYHELARPPYGLRPGPAPLLLIAAMIVHRDEFALYEHGTFRPSLTGDLCERLLRNPNNFQVKCFGAGSGARKRLVRSVDAKLAAPGAHKHMPDASVVSVVSKLVARVNGLPSYAKKTQDVPTQVREFRAVILQATEPDALLFQDIPKALGFKQVGPQAKLTDREVAKIAAAVARAVSTVESTYTAMMADVKEAVLHELRASTGDFIQQLHVRAEDVADKVLDPRVRALIAALTAGHDREPDWLEYVGMQVTGIPPQSWKDDDRRRFFGVLHEIGATFRRVEALNADMRSKDGEFEALRLVANSSSGDEHIRLLTLDPARKEYTQPLIDDAVAELASVAGSERLAVDWLLAEMLTRDIAGSRTADIVQHVDERRYAGRNRRVE